MRKPDEIPQAVHLAAAKWAKAHPQPMHEDCDNRSGACLPCNRGYPELEWDATNGCYFFMHGGAYFGIELNGYIHS